MQTQIIANIVQFAFILFTMAKEEKVIVLCNAQDPSPHLQVKEERGRGLPLSLQSLQGSSTVDSGLHFLFIILILIGIQILGIIIKISCTCLIMVSF